MIAHPLVSRCHHASNIKASPRNGTYHAYIPTVIHNNSQVCTPSDTTYTHVIITRNDFAWTQ